MFELLSPRVILFGAIGFFALKGLIHYGFKFYVRSKHGADMVDSDLHYGLSWKYTWKTITTVITILCAIWVVFVFVEGGRQSRMASAARAAPPMVDRDAACRAAGKDVYPAMSGELRCR